MSNLVTIVIALSLTVCKVKSESYMEGSKVSWDVANNACKENGDDIVKITDLHNQTSDFHFTSIWSSVRGSYTPWIASRGCFRQLQWNIDSWIKKQHTVYNNTVGNCYSKCIQQNTDGGCTSTENFYFGLQGTTCICICDVQINHYSESSFCNIPCLSFIENGFCGGNRYFSLYQTVQVRVDEINMSGFCLTCFNSSNGTLVYHGKDCEERATGYCVDTSSTIRYPYYRFATMNTYWKKCKQRKLYILGSTSACSQENLPSWTGLRQYEITDAHKNELDHCYSIKKNGSSFHYKQRNCTDLLPYVCRISRNQMFSFSTLNSRTVFSVTTSNINRSESVTKLKPLTQILISSMDINSATLKPNSHIKTTIQDQFSTTPLSNFTLILRNVSTTKLSPIQEVETESKQKKIWVIVGAVLAVCAICLSVAFIIGYTSKTRRRFKKSAKTFNNLAYDEPTLDSTVQKQEAVYVNSRLKEDKPAIKCIREDVYAESPVNEYDCLHRSRQKQTSSVENVQYDTTSNCGNACSSIVKSNYKNMSGICNDYDSMEIERDGRNVSALYTDYDTCNYDYTDERCDIYAMQ